MRQSIPAIAVTATWRLPERFPTQLIDISLPLRRDAGAHLVKHVFDRCLGGGKPRRVACAHHDIGVRAAHLVHERIAADHDLRMGFGDFAKLGAYVALAAIRPHGFGQHLDSGLELRRHLVEHGLHDRRHARHDNHVADPESGRGRDLVGDKFSALRHAGHAHARRVQLGSHGGVALLQQGNYPLVVLDRNPERRGDGVGRDGVMGRADPARGEHIGITGAQGIERFDNRRLIVGHDPDFPKIDADPRQVLGDVADVLVLGPAGKDLVANHQEAGRNDRRHRIVYHRMVRLVADAVMTGSKACRAPSQFGAFIDRPAASLQQGLVMARSVARVERKRNPGGGRCHVGRAIPDYGLQERPSIRATALPGTAAPAYKSGMDSTARVSEPPPYRPIAFGPVDIACDAVSGGGFRLRSRLPLAPHDSSLSRMFRAAVEAAPDRAFLAERAGDGWRTLTYSAARPIVDRIAAAFLERGLSAERPVMVLSGNSIDHALLMLAAYTAGIPIAPISVAYSLQSRDHAKLKHVAALLQPG